MAELRWILLAAGLALLAGIYAWGVRARRRSAAPGPERVTRAELPRSAPAGSEVRRVEPEVRLVDEVGAGGGALPVLDVEAAPSPRREPRLGPSSPGHAPAAAAASKPAPAAPASAAASRPAAPAPAAPADGQEPPTVRAQKIVAVRVVAAPGLQFEGAVLKQAIAEEGFTFGRYDIFHRIGAGGRPVVSLASLKEPGTFDPDTLAEGSYRGIVLFTVLPGSLPAEHAFEELIGSARTLAAHLGGLLQDDRGASLSVQRVSHLREEMAEFERAHTRAPAR